MILPPVFPDIHHRIAESFDGAEVSGFAAKVSSSGKLARTQVSPKRRIFLSGSVNSRMKRACEGMQFACIKDMQQLRIAMARL
mgnify:FL=1